jgi:hypothetical protein
MCTLELTELFLLLVEHGAEHKLMSFDCLQNRSHIKLTHEFSLCFAEKSRVTQMHLVFIPITATAFAHAHQRHEDLVQNEVFRHLQFPEKLPVMVNCIKYVIYIFSLAFFMVHEIILQTQEMLNVFFTV